MEPSPLHTIALIDDPELLGPPSDQIPPREEFIRILGADLDGKAAGLLRVLIAKLRSNAEGEPVTALPLEDRLVLIEQLGRFIVAGPAVMHAPDQHPTLARLEMVVRALERIPAAQRRFEATVRSTLAEMRAVKLFGEIGLPNDRGLLAETTDRLARAVLPEPPQNEEMWVLANRIVRKLDELAWLGPAADPVLERFAKVGGKAWEPLRGAVLDAIGLITTRIAAQGISEALRTRAVRPDAQGVARRSGVRESPLYRLTRAQPAEMPALIEASRRHLDHVRVALEDHGVSIDVVYAIDSIERGLSRIELLLPFVTPRETAEPSYEIRAVIAAVGRALVGGRSFVQLMSDNLRLLARKVIERAGRTGEHYVTSSRREYWKMMSSAAGGGVLTLGTAVGKFLVKWGYFPLFIDGALSSVVYSGSFVIMQLLGFTLATKQPSMTAAALAGTIRDRAGPGMLDELVKLIARIARSQFAAAVGNVGAAIVTTLLFDFLYTRATGSPFLGAEASIGIVQSFDPLGSWTIPFAALTGVILWVSSLFAGWFENWVVYRRIPEAIRHHRWGKRLGKKRMEKLAKFLEREAAGFGGSVSLGTMLGMTPVVSKFFGIGLDVRHVTLSSVSLTLAISSVGIDGVGWQAFLLASWGIALIGLLNFGVSFALALIVALRARDVPRGERRTLPIAVLKKFVRKPFVFFYPPKDDPGAAHGQGHDSHQESKPP